MNRTSRLTTERPAPRRRTEINGAGTFGASDNRPGGELDSAELVAGAPETWVNEHGEFLFRFALHRVGRVDIAEDVVQETFLAALKGVDSFENRSSFRTWITGILRRKIADHVRRTPAAASAALERLDPWTEALFKEDGKWRQGPQAWTRWPANSDERAEVTRALERCLGKMPPQIAEMFVLREQHRVPAERLADSLGISLANLWVRLYRARLALRECLESSWFQGDRP